MGLNDRINGDKVRNTKRGTVNNGRRLEALSKRRIGADWANADAKWLLALVTEAQKRGGAIRYGLSRDGGAYAVGVYLEGDSVTLYCNGGDDLEVFLREIYDYLQQQSEVKDGDKGV